MSLCACRCNNIFQKIAPNCAKYTKSHTQNKTIEKSYYLLFCSATKHFAQQKLVQKWNKSGTKSNQSRNGTKEGLNEKTNGGNDPATTTKATTTKGPTETYGVTNYYYSKRARKKYGVTNYYYLKLLDYVFTFLLGGPPWPPSLGRLPTPKPIISLASSCS